MVKMFFVVLLFVFGLESVAMATDTIVLASWYGSRALEGNLMANGEPFKRHDPTIAAHRTLPFGTELCLKSLDNGRELIVVVQDRGPFPKSRKRRKIQKLDLSQAAAEKLGYVEQGMVKLRMHILKHKKY